MPESPSPDSSDAIQELVDQFILRRRNGETISVSEFADAHPKHKTDILELFSVIGVVADLKPNLDEAFDPAAGDGQSGFPEIRDYRVMREIGRGGMGVVYEAEQVKLGRRVALKVLPTLAAQDPAAVDRFQLEARAAASLQHPNIVPVYDVGNTDNYNYYAMQFIVGNGLDQVIAAVQEIRTDPQALLDELPQRTQQLVGALTREWTPQDAGISRPAAPKPDAPIDNGDLQAEKDTTKLSAGSTASLSSVAEKNRYYRNVARIGVEVGMALQHAHENGIIHRDIKPSNILMDAEGKAWVADFGLAKTSSVELTRTGNILGTLRYMSPERFTGPCQEEGDVYSLGATLYEILSFKPVYPATDHLHLVNAIKEGSPIGLRTQDSAIPRDLQTIVEKSLEREPQRRYRSAGAMADDLQRFLDGRPIRARRVGPLERLGLWARNNPLVATLLTLVFLGLIAATLISNRERRRFQNLATQERAARKSAEGIRNFILESFASVEPGKDGRDVTVYDILKREMSSVEVEFADDLLTQAELLTVFGEALDDLGEYEEATVALERAVEILDDDRWRSKEETVYANRSLLKVYIKTDSKDKLLPLVERINSLVQQYHSNDQHLVLSTEVDHGSVLYQLGRDGEALAILEPAAEKSRRLLGSDHDDTISVLGTLIDAYKWNSRDSEALEISRERYHTLSEKYGAESFQAAEAAVELIDALDDGDRHLDSSGEKFTDEYVQLEEKAMRIYAKELGSEHPDSISLRRNIAFKKLGQGPNAAEQNQLAVTIIKETYEAEVRTLGATHQTTINSMGEIARAYMIIDDNESALPYLEKACKLALEHYPASHPMKFRVQIGLGNLYHRLGKHRPALEQYHQIYERCASTHGPAHQESLQCLLQMGGVYLALGEFDQAGKWLTRLVNDLSGSLGNEHPQAINMMIGMVRAQLGAEDFRAAESSARDMLSRLEKAEQEDKETTAFAYVSLAEVYIGLDKPDEAAKAAAKAESVELEEKDRQPIMAQAQMFAVLADILRGDVDAQDRVDAAYTDLREVFDDLHETRRWLVPQACNRAAAVFRKLGDKDSADSWSAESKSLSDKIKELLGDE